MEPVEELLEDPGLRTLINPSNDGERVEDKFHMFCFDCKKFCRNPHNHSHTDEIEMRIYRNVNPEFCDTKNDEDMFDHSSIYHKSSRPITEIDHEEGLPVQHRVVYNCIDYPDEIKNQIIHYLEINNAYDQVIEMCGNINTFIYSLRFGMIKYRYFNESSEIVCEESTEHLPHIHNEYIGFCYTCKCEFCFCTNTKHFQHTYILYFEHPKLTKYRDLPCLIEKYKSEIENIDKSLTLLSNFYSFDRIREILMDFEEKISLILCQKISQTKNNILQTHIYRCLKLFRFDDDEHEGSYRFIVGYKRKLMVRKKKLIEKINKLIRLIGHPSPQTEIFMEKYRKHQIPKMFETFEKLNEESEIIIEGSSRYGSHLITCPNTCLYEDTFIFRRNVYDRSGHQHRVHFDEDGNVIKNFAENVVFRQQILPKIYRNIHIVDHHLYIYDQDHDNKEHNLSLSKNLIRSCADIFSQKITRSNHIYFRADNIRKFIVYNLGYGSYRKIEMIYGNNVQTAIDEKEVEFVTPYPLYVVNANFKLELMNTNIEIMIIYKEYRRSKCIYMTREETFERITLRWHEIDFPYPEHDIYCRYIGAEDNDDPMYGCFVSITGIYFKNRVSIPFINNTRRIFEYSPYHIWILQYREPKVADVAEDPRQGRSLLRQTRLAGIEADKEERKIGKNNVNISSFSTINTKISSCYKV